MHACELSLVKESVADRVRRFKENSPRRRLPDPPPSEENFELTPLSSCESVDDILAVLRARATESVQQTSTDLSEILQDIRTSNSEISRISEPCVNERQKVKALLKRLSLESEELKPPVVEDDPAAVLMRIKERLKMDSSDKTEKKACVVSELTCWKDIVEIPRFSGVDSELQTDKWDDKQKRPLSMVSVLVDDKTWSHGNIIQESQNPVVREKPKCVIKSLATDRHWRRYIQAEIENMRAAIYDRIQAERSSIHF